MRKNERYVGESTLSKMLLLPIPDVTVSIPRRECSLTASRLKSLDKNNKNECSYSFSNAVGTLVMIWGGRLQRHPSW